MFPENVLKRNLQLGLIGLALAAILSFCQSAHAAPIPLSCPWPVGETWQAGGVDGGSFYNDPPFHVGNNCYAVDFNRRLPNRNDNGASIVAVAPGRVSSIGFWSGSGWWVYLDHGNNIESFYLHFKYDPRQNPGLYIGQQVNRGHVIGKVGYVGANSTGPHLHFALYHRVNGVRVSIPPDPMDGQHLYDGAWLASNNSPGGGPTLPYVALNFPPENADIGYTARMSARASDPENGIYKVEFRIRVPGGNWATLEHDHTYPYDGVFDFSLVPPGPFELAAIAYNNKGQTSADINRVRRGSPPVAPVNVRVYPKSNGAEVYWHQPGPATGYRIYYGKGSRQYGQSVNVGTKMPFTITGLENNSQYYFAVTARNAADAESLFSDQVSTMPVLPSTWHPDGTLGRTPDDDVYVYKDNGGFFRFKSYSVLVAYGFHENMAVEIPPKEVAAYPNLGTLDLPDATLVLFNNNPTVYVVDEQKLRRIPTWDDFTALGYQGSMILEISQEDTDLPIGEDFLPGDDYPINTFLKSDTSPAVYRVTRKGQELKKLNCAHVFTSYGFSWEKLVLVDQSVIDQYQLSPFALSFREGALVKPQANKATYVIEHEKLRLIESLNLFNGFGYNWDRVIEVPPDCLTPHTIGDPISSYDISESTVLRLHPDGTLIRNKAGAYSVLENGKRRRIPNPVVLNSWGWAFADAIMVSDLEYNHYTTGPDFPLRPGLLIKKKSSGKIYVIGPDNTRHHITSAQTFEGNGYRWDQIVTVSDAVLDPLPLGDPITSVPQHVPGDLLKGSSAAIWRLAEDGTREKIPSVPVFNSWKFDWNEICVIPDAHLDQYPYEGQKVPFRDGSLLMAEGDPSVFFISHTTKHLIVSAEVFVGLGYRWEDIMVVSQNDLDSLPTGPAIEDWNFGYY